MSTVVSGIRVKLRVTDDDVRVTSDGKLMVVGVIAGTLTVESGGYAYILGMVDGLVIEPGAKATLPGICTGDVTNHGGDLTISGVVKGTVHGRSITRVKPRAKIEH
jgi:cytoskeletal protein CcmA (bactofilin family)